MSVQFDSSGVQGNSLPAQGEIVSFKQWIEEFTTISGRKRAERRAAMEASGNSSIEEATGEPGIGKFTIEGDGEGEGEGGDGNGGGYGKLNFPPPLPDPRDINLDLPPGTQGLGNPWLRPNPSAALHRITLYCAKIQSEIEKMEGVLQAEKTESGMEVAVEKSDATKARGRMEAMKMYVRAATSFANSAISLGTAINSANAQRQARKEVDAETRRLENNPDYKNITKTAKTPKERMEAYQKKEEALETKKGVLATTTDKKEAAKIEKEVEKLEADVQKYKPGVNDIKEYVKATRIPASEKDAKEPPLDPKNPEDKRIIDIRDSQQKNLDEKQGSREKLVADRQYQITTFNEALNRGLTSLFQGLSDMVIAPMEIDIAEKQAFLEILNEGSNVIHNAYQAAGEARSSARDAQAKILDWIERFQAAETQNFGFSGGRAH